jgi:hypothetical protein
MYFLLFFSTFLLINSHINLCKRCKYFIPSFSPKCSLFKKFNYIKNTTDYEYCFLAREMKHLCGDRGKRFVEKEINVEKDKLIIEEILFSFYE